MNKFNTKAVVLKSIKYKDSDKIFTLFTNEYGKMSAIARGVRKISSRRSGNLDTLNLVSVNIHEDTKGFKNIEEVKLIESFKNIKRDLSKCTKAYYMVELLHRSVEEGDKSDGLFELLVKCLKALDKNGYSGDLFVSYFEISLMAILGYRLNFEKCRKCGKDLDSSWKKYSFNIEDGGIECDKCAKFGVEISKDAAIALKPVSMGKFDKKIQESASEIDKLLKLYVGRKLESRFKSLEIDES